MFSTLATQKTITTTTQKPRYPLQKSALLNFISSIEQPTHQ
jgi:hypothetical protein